MPEMLEATVDEPVAEDLERARREEEDRIVDKVIKMKFYLYHIPGKMAEVHDKLTEIIRQLEKKCPDIQKKYLFHILSGSTTDRESCIPPIDLEGENSMIKILEDLVREYKQKESQNK